MATGTVKWFNSTKGFGFIAPDGGGNDVFVHISAVERAGLTTLNDNQKISYEMQEGRDGRSSAGELKLLRAGPASPCDSRSARHLAGRAYFNSASCTSGPQPSNSSVPVSMTGRFIKVGWAASCAPVGSAFCSSANPRHVADARLTILPAKASMNRPRSAALSGSALMSRKLSECPAAASAFAALRQRSQVLIPYKIMRPLSRLKPALAFREGTCRPNVLAYPSMAAPNRANEAKG